MSSTENSVSEIPMKWVWIGVFLVVAVGAGLLTPWEALSQVLESGGVGEEQASLIAFVGGYTFPLTLGIAILVVLAGLGIFDGMHPYGAATLVAAILLGAGWLASELALGLIPQYTFANTGGPPPFRFLIFVLQGYINTYGWALALGSAAIGVGVGLQVVQWRQRWNSRQL